MDPNANLVEQEQLLNEGLNRTPSDFRRRSRQINRRLADLREALLVWLQNGGFEPDWSKAPKARIYFRR